MGILNLPWFESKSEIVRSILVSLWDMQPLWKKSCILAFHPVQEAVEACFELLIKCSKATADARATHKTVRDVESWENENVHRSLKCRHGEGPFLYWAQIVTKAKASEAGAWQLASDPDYADAWWKPMALQSDHVTLFYELHLFWQNLQAKAMLRHFDDYCHAMMEIDEFASRLPVFRTARYRGCWWARLYLCCILHRDGVVVSVPKNLFWQKYIKSFPLQRLCLEQVSREAACELEEPISKLTVKQVLKILKYSADPCLLSCTLCLFTEKALKSLSTEDVDPSNIKASRPELPGRT